MRHERSSRFFPVPQRNRPRCHHRCLSGETSLPGVAGLPTRTFHALESDPPESRDVHPFAPRSASCLSAGIVCLGPRVLSLSPHVVFACSDGRRSLSTAPPAKSEIIASSGSSPEYPVPSARLAHSAMSGTPFPFPVATPGGFDGSTESFSAIGVSITALTHSNNDRSV